MADILAPKMTDPALQLNQYDYDLPTEFIAQQPLAERDKSRLLALDRNSGSIEHKRFFEITEYLRPDDLLVLNDTQVSALRLRGLKSTGARVETLLLRDLGGNRWDSIVKPGRRLDVGVTINFGDNLEAKIVERTEGGGRILDFGGGQETAEKIREVGEIPLPPYVYEALKDVSQYQTVYANQPGSAAAPTAGFHFTPELLAKIEKMGVETAYVTLHVGIATFRPVSTEDITRHVMHREMISISPDIADKINSAKGRIIAIGTTTARTLESAAIGKRRVAAADGETDLFITPGYDFKILDGLVTNFHMPRSTLLILVSAFAGREKIMRAYEEAKANEYRFLSFGDAMMIL